jgi:spore maturation protein A
MLNYIWAGLLLFALIFALATDVSDLRHRVYGNGVPLPATVEYRKLDDRNAREATVDLRIAQSEYAQHFNVSESVATSFPVTLTKMDHAYLLRFAKDAALPPRLAAMRDFADSKELVANVDTHGAVNDRAIAVQLTFPKVRFVKLHAITTAAIDTAKAAVMLSIDLIGVLTLWLGVMKIAEASGLIDLMVKIIQPILGPLFPGVPKGHPALGYIAVNLAGNILGLGNATTAMGLKAMEELQKLNPSDDTATDPMVMLLAMHTAAFQLVPSASLVALMGLASAEVFIPMLLVGFIATVVAIIAAKVLGWLPMYRRTNPDLVGARRAEVVA